MVQVPNGFTVVVGLGVSGQAICRHLTQLGRPFMVADTRETPPGLEALQERFREEDSIKELLVSIASSDLFRMRPAAAPSGANQ